MYYMIIIFLFQLVYFFESDKVIRRRKSLKYTRIVKKIRLFLIKWRAKDMQNYM